jgi:putative ABC transport system permease protein
MRRSRGKTERPRGIAPFRNPVTHVDRSVYIVGVPANARVFANTDWQRAIRALDQPDELLFDARSRPEFGPIAALFRRGEVRSEIAHRSIRIVGLFEMGASFSADGTAITTEEGFARLFPSRASGLVDIGLIHLEPGARAAQVLEGLRAALPSDVLVMTHDELNRREQAYWRGTTPAGFIFKTVLVVSLIVGCVSVYQILSSEVAENLRQYSTLKALGYSDRYFVQLTFEKAWLLTSMAYPVGFLLAGIVYLSATYLTLVPLVMTTGRVVGVYALILAAAFLAGCIAMSRLRRSDPTELF